MWMTVLSYIAFAAGGIGLWIAGRRNIGWLITSLGSLAWVFYAVRTGQEALTLTTIMWFVIEFRNYWINRGNNDTQVATDT